MQQQIINRSNKELMRAIILQAAAVWFVLVGTSALATVRYVDVMSALTNSRLPVRSSPTPGCSNTACRRTARRITVIRMATA